VRWHVLALHDVSEHGHCGNQAEASVQALKSM
jgi:hypothetical protein